MRISTAQDLGVAKRVRPVTGQSTVDAVATAIETRIREDQLQAGDRIGTKQELVERLRVAPATLSEALRVLRSRGVVEVKPGPGGGAFVRDQSPLMRLAHSVLALREDGATINDALGVLDALDEAVIRDAANFRQTKDLRDLDLLVKRLEKSWDDPLSNRTWNWRLHRRIAEITPNSILRAFYLNMVDYIDTDAPAASEDLPSFMSGSRERFQVHADIVEAIRSKDEGAVRAVVLRHRSA